MFPNLTTLSQMVGRTPSISAVCGAIILLFSISSTAALRILDPISLQRNYTTPEFNCLISPQPTAGTQTQRRFGGNACAPTARFVLWAPFPPPFPPEILPFLFLIFPCFASSFCVSIALAEPLPDSKGGLRSFHLKSLDLARSIFSDHLRAC